MEDPQIPTENSVHNGFKRTSNINYPLSEHPSSQTWFFATADPQWNRGWRSISTKKTPKRSQDEKWDTPQSSNPDVLSKEQLFLKEGGWNHLSLTIPHKRMHLYVVRNIPGHHCHLHPCPPMELCIQTGPSLPWQPLLELRRTKEAKWGLEVPRSISPPSEWDPIPNQSKFNTNNILSKQILTSNTSYIKYNLNKT